MRYIKIREFVVNMIIVLYYVWMVEVFILLLLRENLNYLVLECLGLMNEEYFFFFFFVFIDKYLFIFYFFKFKF